MKSKELIQNKNAKKIRKVLLIFVDNEIKKKKKINNYILINSMNPIELENNVQINQEPITISTHHFTNVAENHLIKRIFDPKHNINYIYSDNLGKKKGMLILKEKQENFVIKYSLYNIRMDIGMLLINKEENNKNEENPKDFIQLYSFNLMKKDIGENKIINNNNFLIKSNENNKEDKNKLYMLEKELLEVKKQLKIVSLKFLIKYCCNFINKKMPKRLPCRSVEKYNKKFNINHENYDDKNNINTSAINNIKYMKSKDKILKIKNKEKQNIDIIQYKSSKNN